MLEVARRVLSDLKAEKSYGVSLGTMGEMVYSDLDPEQGHDRTRLEQVYQQIADELDGKRLAVAKGNARNGSKSR